MELMHKDPAKNFYPRPPRGGRPRRAFPNLTRKIFLSTPSARRATGWSAEGSGPEAISIHALREEGDGIRQRNRRPLPLISIHALREEGDQPQEALLVNSPKFLSTPSARRATRSTFPAIPTIAYFYPRPPRGGRREVKHYFVEPTDFYPRPPRGGRLSAGCAAFALSNFYPRPPRGGRQHD